MICLKNLTTMLTRGQNLTTMLVTTVLHRTVCNINTLLDMNLTQILTTLTVTETAIKCLTGPLLVIGGKVKINFRFHHVN